MNKTSKGFFFQTKKQKKITSSWKKGNITRLPESTVTELVYCKIL